LVCVDCNLLIFNLQAYRKAFLEHAGKGENGIRGLMTPRDSSPGGSSFASPLSFIQPRHRNKSTYVQRYKVLRDRNKSLPKLDFNAKASGMPKVYVKSSLKLHASRYTKIFQEH
jgi:hypothetical protein